MVCSTCGIENGQAAEACSECGAPLNPKSASGTPATKSTKVGAMDCYLTVLKKYAVFTGRARRREFWYFFLFQNLIIIALMTLSGLIGSANGPTPLGVLAAMYAIATMIPALAVSVRRLHDINLSGWLCLLVLVPLVGGVILLILCTMDSKAGKNQYDHSVKTDPDFSAQEPTPTADMKAGARSNLGVASVRAPQISTTPAPGHPVSRERVPPRVQSEEPAADTMVSSAMVGLRNSVGGKKITRDRGFPKWAILAVVGIVLAMVGTFAVITFKLFTKYKYLEEKGIQFRVDRYSGRTDELVGASGWVPISFNRPSENLPLASVAHIRLSGVRRLENRVCFTVYNESDYTVKSVSVLLCASAKGCDQNALDQAAQTLEGAHALTLHPVGSLLQKGGADTFCTEWDGAAHSTAGLSGYTVVGAKGWKDN